MIEWLGVSWAALGLIWAANLGAGLVRGLRGFGLAIIPIPLIHFILLSERAALLATGAATSLLADLRHACTQALGLNIQALRLQQVDEDANFSTLFDEVGRELASRYLDNAKFRLIHTSEMMGYAPPASFTRWFIVQF